MALSLSPPEKPAAASPAAWPSLLRRLVLLDALVVCLVAGLASLSLYQSHQDHRQQAEISTRGMARVLQQHMSSVLEKTDIALRSVALAVSTRPRLEADLLPALLLREQTLQPELVSLWITDAAGRVLAVAGQDPGADLGIPGQDNFIRARGGSPAGLAIGGPVPSPVAGKSTLVLSRRLVRGDGSFAGVVFAGIPTDYFRTLLAQLDQGDKWHFSLRTGDLTLVARHPSSANPITQPGATLIPTALRQAVDAAPEQGTRVVTTLVDGVERMVSYARLDRFPLYVFAGQATADYLAAWQQDATEVSVMAALVILGLIAASAALHRSWVRQSQVNQAREIEAHRSRVLLQTATDGIHVLDRNGWLREVNGAFCAQVGYRREELLAMHISDIDPFLPPEDLAKKIDAAFDDKLVFETRHRRKDGSQIDVEVSTSGVTLDGERLIFAAARDITARKLAEAEREQAHRTLTLLSESNTALLHAENEDQLLPELCRLIVGAGGYRMAWVGFAEEDAGRTVRPVAQAGHTGGYLDQIRISWGDNELGHGPTGTAIRTGRPQVCQDMILSPDHAPWRALALCQGYRASIALPLIADGAAFGALNIYAAQPNAFGAQEVSLLEKLASNLAFGISSLRARRRLATTVQELQTFTYAASHDLMAPLRGINSFSQLLETQYRHRLEGDGLLFLDYVRRNARRMGTLIDDLLRYCQVEHTTRLYQPVDLQAATEAVLREFDREIAESGAQVQVALPPVAVLADPGGLAQVLRNLLGNALKYAARSSPPRIDIGGLVEEGRCRLWVRDNGIGFDMVYQERIFDVFRRLHTFDEYPGTGVGLALVRKAMHRMHGRVWAEGVPGQGATFHLELAAAWPQTAAPAPEPA